MDPSPVLGSHDGWPMSSNVKEHRIASEDARSQGSMHELFDKTISGFEQSTDHMSPRKRSGDISAILAEQPLVQHLADTTDAVKEAEKSAANSLAQTSAPMPHPNANDPAIEDMVTNL